LAIEDTIWGVHPAATEVVFLKANFTLLNYLEAGHSSLQTTQGYIDGDSESQRKVVDLI
jgi:hypothetical protein